MSSRLLNSLIIFIKFFPIVSVKRFMLENFSVLIILL